MCEITSGRQIFINYHKKIYWIISHWKMLRKPPASPRVQGFQLGCGGGVCWWIGAVGWGKKITWVELWRVTAPSGLFLPRPAWGSSPYSVPWLRERDLGAGRPVELAIDIKPMSITLNHRGTGRRLEGCWMEAIRCSVTGIQINWVDVIKLVFNESGFELGIHLNDMNI